MKQVRYSSRRPVPSPVADAAAAPADAAQGGRWPGWRQALQPSARQTLALWLALAVLALWLAMGGVQRAPAGPALTQAQFNQALLHAWQHQSLPSRVAAAHDTILPSVVRVTAFVRHPDSGEAVEHGVGTGVVIVDTGIVLTNLHVVGGAHRVQVTFHDGQESTARVIGAQPAQDLAVLQVSEVPDDLLPATLAATADLRPGDHVVAVGFPFGIGPSVSAGVVSGLQRAIESPDGAQTLSNLIQFDAAANPGNSGGPLVNLDGEVLGIVTAIYNPNQQRTFVGIGFAVPIESAAAAAGLPPF